MGEELEDEEVAELSFGGLGVAFGGGAVAAEFGEFVFGGDFFGEGFGGFGFALERLSAIGFLCCDVFREGAVEDEVGVASDG